MELVSRAFTTRQPAVGTSSSSSGGTTLQRHITIYVLVAGIAGGLLLILTILILCKYCNQQQSRRSSLKEAGSMRQSHLAATSQGENDGVEMSFLKDHHRSNNDRPVTTEVVLSGSSGKTATTTTVVTKKKSTTSSAGPSAAAMSSSLGTMEDGPMADEDSYVIQVEPSPLPDTIRGEIPQAPIVKKSLRHASSHPTASSQDPSMVSKRRSDWRNSHRNYRSTPTSTASKEAAAVSYDARRALRDQQQPPPHSNMESGVNPSRRILPKRAGSMKEPPVGSSSSHRSSNPARMQSPSSKRWRCYSTVDYDPCSASSRSSSVVMMETALSGHRHSFPAGGVDPSGSNPSRHHYRQGNSRSKDFFYELPDSLELVEIPGLNRPEDDDGGEEDDTDVSQPSTLTAGPAPRITIRYNDPGSLESVNEDNLFFCLEADSKNEFRERLEKTIHAQYRQVWELRANLEEHSDFFEPPSSPEPAPPELNHPGAGAEVGMMDNMPRVRHSASYESNPDEELLLEDVPDSALVSPSSEDHQSPSKSSTDILLYASPSGMWKRQSYRTFAINSRQQRERNKAVSITSPGGTASNQAQSSFDSIDTIETSSTEASRMDQVTTSFESSATDSTTGLTDAPAAVQSSGSHRMLSAHRGDSGYKSLESSVLPATRPSMGGALSEGSAMATADYDREDCQCQGDLHDDKCERRKPVVFARCTRYGLAKSRSASSGTPGPNPAAVLRPQQSHPLPRKLPQSLLARDYSIDERTDALFREFSRCDPVYEGSSTNKQPSTVGSRKDLRPPAGFHRARWISQQRQEQLRFLSLQSHPDHQSTDAGEVILKE